MIKLVFNEDHDPISWADLVKRIEEAKLKDAKLTFGIQYETGPCGRDQVVLCVDEK